MPIIKDPAPYVPSMALSFGDVEQPAVAVSTANPLPVALVSGPAGVAPLVGSAAASTVAGPFSSEPGREVWLTLSGIWSGTITVLRSTDGGASKLPLTIGGEAWAVFTANAQEAVGTETVAGASYYLDIALVSGTLAYRVQQ
ncbi:MAG: hypothetical protein RLZZ08_106 [Pseudomonadota bacterium]|jgi:hypothetical protein